ncbi:CaiB/BaiF CoA transferase family protein [Pseudorhodoferax sp.]|uniref:CaiB/BaiF CoA transferase family protein n=1 Tax=Pseudorhodoferax sp. TaxID=1993553 RepID=UPI002DD67EC6|nr:CaiB/BaiF CoA-transferase family protein [Pseudorhodoferax sp.]
MSGTLHGLKVIEIAGIGPAPFSAMMLADMGADVIRIERANAPASGFEMPVDCEFLNRGRRSVALDLKTPEGVAQLKRLIVRADMLFEGYRPGAMERLGLGPQDCWDVNPRLVYGRMTGFGQTGPLAGAAGHDINYIALSGALAATGPREGPPVPPLNLVGDFGGGGMLLTVGLLAAYIEAQRSGKGQVVDAAMVDGATLLMTGNYAFRAAGYWKDERFSNLIDGGAPWYSVYATADGRHVALGSIEPRFYQHFLQRAGVDPASLPAQHDQARWPELRQALAALFASRTAAQWSELLEGGDACFAPVLSMPEAPDHPHMRAREAFIEVGGQRQPAPAPRFSRTPSAVRSAPPRPGQHTEEVLREWGAV